MKVTKTLNKVTVGSEGGIRQGRLLEEAMFWDFPDSPVVRNQCFHCWGSIPGWGAKIL